MANPWFVPSPPSKSSNASSSWAGLACVATSSGDLTFRSQPLTPSPAFAGGVLRLRTDAVGP